LDMKQRTSDLIDRLTGLQGEKPFGRPLSMDEGKLLAELHTVGGDFDPATYTGAPTGKLSELMDLYKRARRASGSPELYPTLTSDAKQSFRGITDALGRVIRTEVAQDDK